MPLYVIQHKPTRTYFPCPIRDNTRQRRLAPIAFPFVGPPRMFNTEAMAQNALRWWKGRLISMGDGVPAFFDELIIQEVKLTPVRSAKYLGSRVRHEYQVQNPEYPSH